MPLRLIPICPLWNTSSRLAERHDCRLHTHCGETLDEIAYCEAQFRRRPIDYLDDVGWLTPRTWLAHGIHFTDEEVRRLGCLGVCHCPTSNMVLASGRCRTCELEGAGSPVGLGVDGAASNDSSNTMEAVRHALMLGRLSYGAEAVTHLDALRWGTEGSARCLGREDIGRIAPGLEADLALFTLDEMRLSGSHDPIAALVLCGATLADRVMVAGRRRSAGRRRHALADRRPHEARELLHPLVPDYVERARNHEIGRCEYFLKRDGDVRAFGPTPPVTRGPRAQTGGRRALGRATRPARARGRVRGSEPA